MRTSSSMRSPQQAAVALCLFAVVAAFNSDWSIADEAGVGRTTSFEVRYLKFIADHHYSALRITELAAGTDERRDGPITPDEGTSPTPGEQLVTAKASSDELKSMARRNNRMQREEILTALGFLRDWYGVDYQPHVRPVNQAQIELLEAAPTGSEFDHLFMEVLSRHHFMALEPSVRCQVASDLTHAALNRYCSPMTLVLGQTVYGATLGMFARLPATMMVL